MWMRGDGGQVTVAGTDLSATAWYIDYLTDTIDVSNFKGFGWAAYLAGVPDIDVRVDAVWDTIENPFTPNRLAIGIEVNLILFVERSVASEKYSMQAMITEILNEQAVRDTVRYSFMAKVSAYLKAVTVVVPGDL